MKYSLLAVFRASNDSKVVIVAQFHVRIKYVPGLSTYVVVEDKL